jgi:hypothetical protein
MSPQTETKASVGFKAGAVVSPPFLYLSLSLLLESSVSSSSSSSEKWPMVRIFSHLSVTMELEW